MIYVVRLYEYLTGHLYTQLRPHSSRPHTYLVIEFWLTEDDYLRVRRSVAFRAREEWLKAITVARVYVGIFLSRMEGSNENITQARNA